MKLLLWLQRPANRLALECYGEIKRRTGPRWSYTDCLLRLVPAQLPPPSTDFTSALEGHKTPKSWIREAVLSGFNVTGKPVIESWVSGNRHDQVIPAIELSPRQLSSKLLLGAERPRDRVARVGIEHGHFGLNAGDIRDTPRDCATTVRMIFGGNVESCRAGADATLEVTHESIGALNREITGRRLVPRIGQVLARFHRVCAHQIRRIARAHLKHHGRATQVEKLQGGCRKLP